MANWYMKGQSNYESSSGFHMALYFDMNGYPEANYNSIKMPDSVSEGDPFMAFGAETKPTWNPGTAVIEIGLWDDYRIKIDDTGIWGWHEGSGVWFNLFSGGGGGVISASNVGTDGLGVFKQLIDDNLEFKNIAPASSKITVVANGDDIDIDVAEGQISHDSIADVSANDHHTATVGGDLTHDSIASPNGNAEEQHMTSAQITALHAQLTNLTELGTRNHNDLLNIDAADIKHITAAQLAALHAKQHAMDSATYHTSSDIATLNSSTSKHGFLKKLDNVATNFMDGEGNWSAPAGGGGGPTITEASGAPTITPDAVGDIYINTDNLAIYIAAATVGAYSWGYVGKAQSSAFNKDTIANLKLWYDAAVGITKDGGDLVSQWDDQSDTIKNLIQVVGASQPLWLDNQINSLPMIRFDGVNDFMRTVTFGMIQPLTVFLVLKVISSAGLSDSWIDGFTNNTLLFIESATNSIYLHAGNSIGGIAFVDTISYIWTGIFNGANSAIQRDNGAPTTGNVGTGSPAGFNVGCKGGGSEKANIAVAEILIYNAALSGANQDIVRNYLNNKYAIY